MFEERIEDGVLRLRRPETRWLSTGWNGGIWRADAAYNITVPEGWETTELESYISKRRARAGFTGSGPTLLTGVSMQHARCARLGPVAVYATAGLSNPATLPVDAVAAREKHPTATPDDSSQSGPGTVNLIAGTTRRLEDGALSNLVAVLAEAKAATLLETTGFTGTTSDAVIVGCDPDGETATFSGSATTVGAGARACVREAVRASLASRYPDSEYPDSVADAEYGVTTDRRATVSTVADTSESDS